MLDKLVIHLKNIIFFKAVLYVVMLVALFVAMPIFKEDLTKASHRRAKSRNSLNQVILKLDSVDDFKAKITEINDKYQKLVNGLDNQGCINRTRMIDNLHKLSVKYNLFEPISANILQMFDSDVPISRSKKIKINNHELSIKFHADNYETVLDLSKEIYLLLPKGSIITYSKIHQIESLTPRIIDNLSGKKSPGLIEVMMKVHLREIVYE